MALLGSSITKEAGLRLLLCPLGSNVVIRTACCSVGIALPVYSTFKAIESKDQDEQRKWLMYWIGSVSVSALVWKGQDEQQKWLMYRASYGSFSIVEVFSDKLLSWFPVYYHLKFAFLVWLQLPSADGAKQLYRTHFRPFLLRHQARVDQLVGYAYHEMVRLISSHQAEIQFAKTIIIKIIGTADHMLRGTVNPDQPGGRNAIEGPGTPTTITDTERDRDN